MDSKSILSSLLTPKDETNLFKYFWEYIHIIAFCLVILGALWK